jgi:hypothetical protein
LPSTSAPREVPGTTTAIDEKTRVLTVLGHPTLAALDLEFGTAIVASPSDELRLVRVGDEIGPLRIEAVSERGLVLRPTSRAVDALRHEILEVWLSPAGASGKSDLHVVAREPSAAEPPLVNVVAGSRERDEEKPR